MATIELTKLQGAELLDRADHPALTELAKRENPRIKRWISIKSGSSTRRYRCNICGTEIESESAGHRVTQRVRDAIAEHREHELHRVHAGRVTGCDLRDCDAGLAIADWYDEHSLPECAKEIRSA